MRNKVNKILALATGALVVGLAAPSVVSAWGDSSSTGLRRGYTLEQIRSGILGNRIVFNSITDSEPIGGDERNFVGAREKTEVSSAATNQWKNNDITVENGKEYVIRLYVHNNNPGGRDAVAKNTKVAFSIPSTSAKQVQVNGFISADNADPNEYWDYVNFNADQAFHLEYVYGSALLENKGVGKNGGVKLGDEIVTQATKGGVLIGYDKLDGNIPGCYGYASYVTIRVKAVFDTDYLIDKEVRLIGGEKVWSNYVNAEIGDIVEFRISYKNLSNEIQNQVAIKDILPKSLRYIPGTTKLVNVGYPNGTVLSPDGLILEGLSIGDYTPGSNAYLYLRAEVVGDTLACGKNTLVNWAQGSVGVVTIQDYASVVVNKTCPSRVTEKTYNLTIHYVYENGTTAFEDKSVSGFHSGDPYNVASPVIQGYFADIENVAGQIEQSDVEVTVTYKTIPEKPGIDDIPEVPEQPTEPVTPEPSVTPKTPEQLPSTGTSDIVGTIIALGSTATASGYYIASRRSLKK